MLTYLFWLFASLILLYKKHIGRLNNLNIYVKCSIKGWLFKLLIQKVIMDLQTYPLFIYSLNPFAAYKQTLLSCIGIGGNLVAIQSSRISTYLHFHCAPGEVPDEAKGCYYPCRTFCGTGQYCAGKRGCPTPVWWVWSTLYFPFWLLLMLYQLLMRLTHKYICLKQVWI